MSIPRIFGRYIRRGDGTLPNFNNLDRWISEHAPDISSGKYHLHAHWNSRNKKIDWILTAHKTAVCHVKGRCELVSILMMKDLD